MYLEFFNLNSKPFELLPNPDFIFLSKSHKRAITYIDYGIRERAGFILLTGEVGSGKTTIIRDLIKKRDEKVLLAKIFNTRVNSEQLLSMINDDFGLPVQGKDKITLLRELNLFLIEQYAQERQPVLIIDEAQNLSPELLEEIRMLSNLETDSAKLLQIILVGQPELRRTLADPSMRQLRQRISINCNISPLSRAEVEAYILHRLEVAGNRDAVQFDPEALEIIYIYSRGIPRLINIICDFMTISAFAEETHLIDGALARDVVGDLDFEEQYWGDGYAFTESASKGIEAPSPHATVDDQNVFLFEVNRKVEALQQQIFHPSQEDIHGLAKRVEEIGARNAELEETVRREMEALRGDLSLIVQKLVQDDKESKQENPPPKKSILRALFLFMW